MENGTLNKILRAIVQNNEYQQEVIKNQKHTNDQLEQLVFFANEHYLRARGQ